MRGFSGLSSLKDLAEQSKVTDKGLGYLLLPLEDVVSKAQVRKRFKGIEELAQTIKLEQLQTPIQVAPKNEDGKYVILRGERRWRACKLLGMKDIKAIIDDTQYEPASMLIGEMIENVQRDDLDPIEIARGVQRLVDEHDLKPSEVAERLGKTRSYVSMHLAIAESIPAPVEQLLQDDFEMGAETLYVLGQLDEKDPDAVVELCNRAREESRGVTRTEAREALRRVNRPEEYKEEQPDLPMEHTPAVVPSQPIQPEKKHRQEESSDEDPTDQEPYREEQESFAGETFESPQSEPESLDHALPSDTTTAAAAPTMSATDPSVAIELTVLVHVDDDYKEGKIIWSRKAPNEGHVFVDLGEGMIRSFSISEIELMDVRNVEDGGQ